MEDSKVHYRLILLFSFNSGENASKRAMNCVLCAVITLLYYVYIFKNFPNSDLEIFQSKMLLAPDGQS